MVNGTHTHVYLHCEQRRHTLFISQLDLFLHHMSSRNLSSYVLKEQSCNTGVHRHLVTQKGNVNVVVAQKRFRLLLLIHCCVIIMLLLLVFIFSMID
jgi:hypothetical protein